MSVKSSRDCLSLQQLNIELNSPIASNIHSDLLRSINPGIKLPEDFPRRGSQSEDIAIALSADSGPLLIGGMIPQPSPHRLVTMIAQKISNSVISGNGVGNSGPQVWVNWLAKGAQATHESPDDFVYWPAPPPGRTYEIRHHNIIYRGAIEDGCGLSSNFEINLRSNIEQPQDEAIGSFDGTDSILVNGTAFWNFQYSINADAGNGNRSRFDISGIVSANCTNALP